MEWIKFGNVDAGFTPALDAVPVEGIDGRWPAVCAAILEELDHFGAWLITVGWRRRPFQGTRAEAEQAAERAVDGGA